MPRTMKRGDTYKPFTGSLRDADGPVPLGSANEVRLLLRRDDGRLVECVVTVVDPAARRGEPDCGKWTYTPLAADTAQAGAYAAEMEVTWSTGQIQTFPNTAAANEKLTMDDDLNPLDA